MQRQIPPEPSADLCPRPKPLRPTTKAAAILNVFANGEALDVFKAERLHDSCLVQTVQVLERKGYTFERVLASGTGFRGGKIQFTRFRLTPHSLARAREALGMTPLPESALNRRPSQDWDRGPYGPTAATSAVAGGAP